MDRSSMALGIAGGVVGVVEVVGGRAVAEVGLARADAVGVLGVGRVGRVVDGAGRHAVAGDGEVVAVTVDRDHAVLEVPEVPRGGRRAGRALDPFGRRAVGVVLVWGVVGVGQFKGDGSHYLLRY